MTEATPRPRLSRGARIGLGSTLGALVLLGGAWVGGWAATGTTLPPNTEIEGVRLGGLSSTDAEAKLRADLAERAAAPLTVTVGEQALTKTPQELGLVVDYPASVQAAGGGRSWNPVDIVRNLAGGSPLPAVVVVDDATGSAALGELADRVNVDPTNATLTFEGVTPRVTDAVPGTVLDTEATLDAVADAYLGSTEVAGVTSSTEADITSQEATQALEAVAGPAVSAPIQISADGTTFEVTPEMVAGALTFVPEGGELAASVDAEALLEAAQPALEPFGFTKPKDARFTFTNGKPTIVPSADGVGIAASDLAEAVEGAMTRASDRTGSVDVGPQQAGFTTADAEKLGVKEITGEFTTTFPATAYRVNNIGKSAGLVNGVLLKPGEEFSMNKVLGPRTLARGWMAGGAIDGGKVVERMGGGISQTTTTTFNAIFFAGLEDVQHKPHSLYFSRYPMGREATLDYDSVEMIFRNNTQYGVLMQAFTNNPKVGGTGTVTVRVWSTKVYDVKATTPVQSNFTDPGPAIQDDGAVCTPQSAMRGFTVRFDRQFYQDGKLVKSEPYKWTYNTLTPRVCTNPNATRDRIER